MLDPAQPLPPSSAPLVDPNELRTWVLFENEKLLVIDKPGWLVVHPSKNGPWSSLAGALREGFGLDAIRFIYRLDRETSGVIILGKDEATGSRLQKSISKRRVGKAYVALLEGELRESVTVDQPLGPDPTTRVTVKQRVVEAGSEGMQAATGAEAQAAAGAEAQTAHDSKSQASTGARIQTATTIFHPLVSRGGFTLVGVELLTGRKHQIRAHASWLGHRVVGDKLYGPDPELYLEFAEKGWTERHSAMLAMTRQALHCAAIDLRPAGMDFLFRAPWPKDMAQFAERRMGLPAAEAEALIERFTTTKLEAAYQEAKKTWKVSEDTPS